MSHQLHPAAAAPLFENLGDEALGRLRALSSAAHYEAGATIVAEGVDEPFMYVIERGRVRVVKSDSSGAGSHAIAEMGAGETFGEMKLVKQKPAVASIVAIEPVDVMRIDLARLRAEPDECGLREAILANVTSILSSRLHGTGRLAVDALRAELEAAELRTAAGRFIVYLAAITSGFLFIIAAFSELPWLPHQPVMNVFGLFVVGPMVLLLRRSPLPAAAYGITLRTWRRDAWVATLYTLPLLALVVAGKLAWLRADPARHAAPLFDPGAALDGAFSPARFAAIVAVYSLFAVLQELFVRVGLQGSISLFIPRAGGKTNWLAIVVANLLFASVHVHLGLKFMLASFVPGLFWGWLFDRQRSFVGVAASHALVGSWALYLVGLQAMIDTR